MTNSKQGFTIVELLIVIVVIAILAAISVVAYTGIQNRAYDTTVKSDLRNVASTLQQYFAIHGTYPTHAQAMGNAATNNLEPRLKLTRSAYRETVNNGHICVVASGDNPRFAFAAVSKSGNAFYYSSAEGLKDYTWSWTGASATTCPNMGIPDSTSEAGNSSKWSTWSRSGSGWTSLTIQ